MFFLEKIRELNITGKILHLSEETVKCFTDKRDPGGYRRNGRDWTERKQLSGLFVLYFRMDGGKKEAPHGFRQRRFGISFFSR